MFKNILVAKSLVSGIIFRTHLTRMKAGQALVEVSGGHPQLQSKSETHLLHMGSSTHKM